MIVPAPRAAIAAQPRADRLAHRARHRVQRHAAARRGEGAHRRAPELRRHDLRHRPHRRRAQRRHPAAALFGVPHRQRDQQRHLEELRGHRQARPRSAWIVPLSLGDSHHGFRVLGTTPDYFERYKYRHGQALDVRRRRAVQRPVRRRDRRRRAAGARLQGRRPDRRRARRRLGVVRRARRQAVPRLRHPRQDRHAGRPHRARQPRGHRGDPRRLAERHAGARARACRPTRCARWTSSRRRSRRRWSA